MMIQNYREYGGVEMSGISFTHDFCQFRRNGIITFIKQKNSGKNPRVKRMIIN